MSYNAKVYKKQGGNELVVADGGKITVEDGGIIVLDVGATIENDGDLFTSLEVDDTTVEVVEGTLQVKDAGIGLDKLASEVTDLLGLIAAIPTADPENGETIWNDNGVLKVASAGGESGGE